MSLLRHQWFGIRHSGNAGEPSQQLPARSRMRSRIFDENLRAWCQRCHLSYDAQHHARTARATRRQGKALAELFPT